MEEREQMCSWQWIWCIGKDAKDKAQNIGHKYRFENWGIVGGKGMSKEDFLCGF